MITYPVNLTDRFTFKLGGSTFRNRPWPRADGQPIQNPDPSLVALLESKADIPSFDPATQKLDQGAWVDNVQNETAIFTFNVIAQTAEEQTAYAENVNRQAKRTLVANAIPSLRQWAIDADAVVVTGGNSVATLQTTLDRLSVFFDRFADLLEVQRIDKS